MSNLPLIAKCPGGGEDWPITSFKASVDSLVEKVTPRHVHFWCPAGHIFTLATAKKERMFNNNQVSSILTEAQRTVDQNRGTTEG